MIKPEFYSKLEKSGFKDIIKKITISDVKSVNEPYTQVNYVVTGYIEFYSLDEKYKLFIKSSEKFGKVSAFFIADGLDIPITKEGSKYFERYLRSLQLNYWGVKPIKKDRTRQTTLPIYWEW